MARVLTQEIVGTECIGDSLQTKINPNFLKLDEAVQTLSSTNLIPVDTDTIDLTFNTVNRQLDGIVKDNSITNAKLAFDGGTLSFRNKIINGGFDIWQRGATFNNINRYTYTADRWTTSTTTNVANKNVSRQTLLATDLPAIEAGLIYYLRGSYTSGTQVAEWAIGNPIELSVTGRSTPLKVGKQYTLSYYARTQGPYTIPVTLQYRDGTASAILKDVAATNQAVTTSWARYTFTFTMLEPDSTNTCFVVYFGRGNVPINTNIDITGVQLEEGPTATPFEQRPIGTELALCQRYYQFETGRFHTFPAGPYSEATHDIRITPMRSSPTTTCNILDSARLGLQGSPLFSGTNEKLRFSADHDAATTSAGYVFYSWTASAEL
jgi:hypothetical protein